MKNFYLTGKISNKTFITSELVMRWICHFRRDNISQFTKDQIVQCGIGHNDVKKYLEILEENKEIENLTENGYAYKIKLNTIKPCYKFLIDNNITKTHKFFLLVLFEYNKIEEIKYSNKNLSKIFYGNDQNSTGIYNYINRIKNYGYGSYIDILNNPDLTSEVIDNNLYSNELYTETQYGFIANNRKEKVFNCQYCGESDPSKFSGGSSKTCNKCRNIRRKERERENITKWLLSKTLVASNKKGWENDLDMIYLEELLNKQGNKCYYTNKNFGNDEFNSPSVDRIDSGKGYIKGNVVICRAGINIMKNNLDLESFKKEVCNIYENLDNIK
jgi:hypothetical protein